MTTKDGIALEPERRRITGISATTCFELERRGEFPRRVALLKDKNGNARRVGWKRSELHAWVESRQVVTLKAPEASTGITPAH